MTDSNNIMYANQNALTKFEGFYPNRYVDPHVSGYSFVFVTKPSLFLYPYPVDAISSSSDTRYYQKKLAYDNMTKDQMFTQYIKNEALNSNDQVIIEQLSFYEGIFSSEFNRYRSNFLPIFTNKVKGFNTMDTVMDQYDGFQTKQGYRLPLPSNKTQSEAANSISLQVYETQNLDIMKFLNIWVNYISNITDGTFHANPEMVKNGIVDYMSSIYYFSLEPDGRTLKYWAKYTGCWPNIIPYSQLGYIKGQSTMTELDVSFLYTTKEDMTIAILEDFNKVSLNITDTRDTRVSNFLGTQKNKWLTIDSIREMVGNLDVETPLILLTQGTNSNKFELTFGKETYSDVGSYVGPEVGKEDYFFDDPSTIFGSDMWKKD